MTLEQLEGLKSKVKAASPYNLARERAMQWSGVRALNIRVSVARIWSEPWSLLPQRA
jgi:hypothetical protein